MDIRVENVTYIYNPKSKDAKKALENISFEIPKGESVGIMGKTGSGKSTLINLLKGLRKPTSGTIYIDNKDITKKNGILNKVGIVFQYPESQLFKETVYEDIAFGPVNIKMSDIEDAVKEAMEFVGLPESFEEKSPFELSRRRTEESSDCRNYCYETRNLDFR